MLVAHRRMDMDVRVSTRERRHFGPVGVLVMLVVDMEVIMHEGFVFVPMIMVLRHVKPHADRHQNCRQNKLRNHRLSQHQNGSKRSSKWCR